MRMKLFVIAMLVMSMGTVAFAELQNVEVDGSIRIRGNLYLLDDGDDDISFIEQRTRLGVTADFTDDVSARIEVDSWDIWGEDFRSNYLTGIDRRQARGDDVEIYESYINVQDMWGHPISLRVGRQELSLGNEMFVGVNDTSQLFTGLSFDAIVLTYANDVLSIQGIMAKLADTFGDFFEDDVNMYSIYGSYTGIEDHVIEAYWIWLEDDEATIGNDIDIHTIGLRGAGVVNAFDYEAEIAYQFGDIDDVDWILWWDTDVDYDELAVNLELGYTFDADIAPRLFAKFAYYGGGDLSDRDHDGLFWWWGDQDIDMPFNRVFSNIEYSEFLDETELSNLFYYALGLEVTPTESLALALVIAYFEVDQERTEHVPCPFYDWEADDELGWEIGLYADYNYSEDLVIRAGWAHFFGDDGLEDRNLINSNGITANMLAGDDDDDYDYLFIETEIAF